jgi:hypothetical protein
MFQWPVTASPSNINESPKKMKAVYSFKTLGKNNPSTHCHNLEAINPQHQTWWNLKSHNKSSVWLKDTVHSALTFPQGTLCLSCHYKPHDFHIIYSVIRKCLRNFRPQRNRSRDGHAEGEHVNRGRDTPSLTSLQVLGMSALGDATDVNPVIKFLPHTLQHLTVNSSDCLHDVVNHIYHSCDEVSWRQSLLSTARTVWQELDYRIDTCCITKDGHIEHL